MSSVAGAQLSRTVVGVSATALARPEAAAYLNFLRSGIAKAVFEQYGFTFLVRPTS